jgi:RHS repeat-associated protein
MLNQVISKETSNTIATYTYDYMGRRSGSTDSSGNTTYYHYNGWNVVAESDSSGNITANYYYDNNGQIMAMKKNGNYYYYQFNAHGDVVSLTDENGNVVNSYKYDPWGKLLSISETISNPYRYAGYRYDTDTGLYYLRARYYNPEIMRFMTKDLKPGYLINPQTLNSYLYCNNNPVNLIDITGEDWFSSSVSLGGVVTAVGSTLITAGVIATSPEWTTAGAIVLGGALIYTGYQYYTGQISGFQAGVSIILTGLSAVPYIGPAFALGGLGWESGWSLNKYYNGVGKCRF